MSWRPATAASAAAALQAQPQRPPVRIAPAAGLRGSGLGCSKAPPPCVWIACGPRPPPPPRAAPLPPPPFLPLPPALPPRASRVPSILIGSLFLFCRCVSGATRTLCCCSFCSLSSCPDPRRLLS
ncbi:formin-like protein 16 [Mastomys coucha]|uniref:formin-like protein 16 n=1 Tax=Mastomys coucha TaxID=35658 RepID=UPI00126158EC|nr:formin-like protein 16 [Mastomys coucha]